jgi:zinc-binding alcohol dehydrogenase family protein
VRRKVSPQEGEIKVLGWDAAGIVREVGSEVRLFKPEDNVFYAGSISRSGTNAERHLVDERIVGMMPSSISFAQAAALPLTALTAWELLFDRLKVKDCPAVSGKELLIIGAAGGVGSIMIQLAKKQADLTVIATASNTESQEWVKKLGADFVIDHTNPLSDGIRRYGISSVAYVASLNHTESHFEEIVRCLAPQGRLGLIDDPPIPLDIMMLKPKCASLHWEFMFARSEYQTKDMIEQHNILNAVAELVDKGLIQTTLAQNLGPINAENMRRAHALVESGSSRGKIVLEGF